MRAANLVYESLIGELIDPIQNVPNAFAPGSFCEGQYREMLDAYDRLRERLGVGDEDADVEIMIDSLLSILRELCLQMFDFGGTVL